MRERETIEVRVHDGAERGKKLKLHLAARKNERFVEGQTSSNEHVLNGHVGLLLEFRVRRGDDTGCRVKRRTPEIELHSWRYARSVEIA